jgi:predicted aspartyl protease
MGQDPRTRRGVSESPIKPPRYAVKVLAEWAKGSLIADGWVQEKPYRVTIDTGASATVARPDIVAGLPERELSQPYVLQTASGETMPVVKEAHVELTMGQRTLRSWVFVADMADAFIMGLDILRANDASVDIGHRMLRLGQDEVPVREAPTQSESKRARPTENRGNWRPVCWQCGRTGHLWRGCPRGPAKETDDSGDWRRDCATDEKQRLDACEAAWERQIEELKAKVVEIEAELERKTESTTEAPKEEGSEAECQRRVTCRGVQMVAAADPDDRERVALRRGQLASDRVEARQNRPIDSIGITEGDRVRPYRPARRRRVTKRRPGRQRGPPGPVPP